MDTVNGIGRNIHSALETKGHIRAKNIIINGFRKRYDIQSLFPQEIRCFL